ncbi:MAG: hypothetical protein LQ351_004920 [Letrouitia transgressa]|nr:MAG: hypothetical protein LQ351_004920 [Letrouitia transgressa]
MHLLLVVWAIVASLWPSLALPSNIQLDVAKRQFSSSSASLDAAIPSSTTGVGDEANAIPIVVPDSQIVDIIYPGLPSTFQLNRFFRTVLIRVIHEEGQHGRMGRVPMPFRVAAGLFRLEIRRTSVDFFHWYDMVDTIKGLIIYTSRVPDAGLFEFDVRFRSLPLGHGQVELAGNDLETKTNQTINLGTSGVLGSRSLKARNTPSWTQFQVDDTSTVVSVLPIESTDQDAARINDFLQALGEKVAVNETTLGAITALDGGLEYDTDGFYFGIWPLPVERKLTWSVVARTVKGLQKSIAGNPRPSLLRFKVKDDNTDLAAGALKTDRASLESTAGVPHSSTLELRGLSARRRVFDPAEPSTEKKRDIRSVQPIPLKIERGSSVLIKVPGTLCELKVRSNSVLAADHDSFMPLLDGANAKIESLEHQYGVRGTTEYFMYHLGNEKSTELVVRANQGAFIAFQTLSYVTEGLKIYSDHVPEQNLLTFEIEMHRQRIGDGAIRSASPPAVHPPADQNPLPLHRRVVSLANDSSPFLDSSLFNTTVSSASNAIYIHVPNSEIDLNIYIFPDPIPDPNELPSFYNYLWHQIQILERIHGPTKYVKSFQKDALGLEILVTSREQYALTWDDLFGMVTGLRILEQRYHPTRFFKFDIFWRRETQVAFGELIKFFPTNKTALLPEGTVVSN